MRIELHCLIELATISEFRDQRKQSYGVQSFQVIGSQRPPQLAMPRLTMIGNGLLGTSSSNNRDQFNICFCAMKYHACELRMETVAMFMIFAGMLCYLSSNERKDRRFRPERDTNLYDSGAVLFQLNYQLSYFFLYFLCLFH